MKWGKKYGPEYVNRLYNMVSRHLSLPFKMVCLTDDATDINKSIDCYPIPELPLPDGIPERGWKKLTTFGTLYGLTGTALFLDIDIVITGSLDDFFLYEADKDDAVYIIKDWKKPWRGVGNSSVYRFKIGAFDSLLPYFAQNFDKIRKQFRHEQAFLSNYMHQNHRLAYWPKAWCASYKYHCMRPIPLAYFADPILPADARIVIFHGEINPPDALNGGYGKWYRYTKPAKWIQDAWR